jgi:hypothetical protein
MVSSAGLGPKSDCSGSILPKMSCPSSGMTYKGMGFGFDTGFIGHLTL